MLVIKKATGPLSPILIPNHSQHKAPHPGGPHRKATPPGLTSYLPAKIPQTSRQEAIVGGREGGPEGAEGLPHCREPLTGSQLTRVVVAMVATYHAGAAAGLRLINKKVSAAGK